jgi:hypothetical protein
LTSGLKLLEASDIGGGLLLLISYTGMHR